MLTEMDLALRPTRFRAQGYRSLQKVDLPLGGLSVLVGRNSAGKSNVVDALRFIADALAVHLDHALTERGGVDQVRRRASRRPPNFSLEVFCEGTIFWDGEETPVHASFAFEVGPREGRDYRVTREEAKVARALPPGEVLVHYNLLRGRGGRGEELKASRAFSARPDERDLFLRSLTAEPGLGELYQALIRMATYNPSPEVIREPQNPDPYPFLRRDGRNLASILSRMPPERKSRVQEFLAALVPGVQEVYREVLGPKETLGFKQVWDNNAAWGFLAHSISDGTLRATALLVAVFQTNLTLVAVEEPETALHPASVRKLTDALLEASREKPILVTTHSPDLLDHPGLDPDKVFLVEMDKGKTFLRKIHHGQKEVIREHLFTLGELLRENQLAPEETEVAPEVSL